MYSIKVLEINFFSAVKYVHWHIVFNCNLIAEILILVRVHAVSKVPGFVGFLLWLLVGFFSWNHSDQSGFWKTIRIKKWRQIASIYKFIYKTIKFF
jgi:hypothetical protein